VCTLAMKEKIRAGFDMSDRTIPLLDRAATVIGAYPTYMNENKRTVDCVQMIGAHDQKQTTSYARNYLIYTKCD
jgi:hypothetical protein